MLSATAYTFRQKARLAVSLAWIGGFVDAIGFLLLSTFTSNMTGNSAVLAARLAAHSWTNALWCGFVILMFLAGASLSGALTHAGKRLGQRSIYSLALFIEAGLLCGWLILAHQGMRHPWLLAALPAMAMGLQNATITQIAGAVVRTTHVTGVLTDLGLETIQLLLQLRDRSGKSLPVRLRGAFYLSGHHVSIQRLAVLASIWCSFVAGAALGAWGYVHLGPSILACPILFLVGIVLFDLIRPIASLDPVDHARQDPMLKRFGIDPGMLPDSVAVLRIEARGRRRVRAPDLGHIASASRHQLRVVLLILSPDVNMNANAVEGLHNSLRLLRASRQELVVCPMEPALFTQIRDSVFGQELGESNICADPEFAAARAVDLATTTPSTKASQADLV